MELTKNEKEVLIHLLKAHISEIDEANDTPNLPFKVFAAEEKYEEFLRRLLDKLK